MGQNRNKKYTGSQEDGKQHELLGRNNDSTKKDKVRKDVKDCLLFFERIVGVKIFDNRGHISTYSLKYVLVVSIFLKVRRPE